MRLLRLKEIRKATGETQESVARGLDIPLSTYQGWEQLKNNPELPRVSMLADYFNVSVDDLLGKEVDDCNPAFVKIPYFGSIAAGTPIDIEYADGVKDCPTVLRDKYPEAFYLKVEGESMNRRIPNGCLALIDPKQIEPNEQDAYAVCVNGYEATIKRIKRLANGFELIPDSYDPTYLPKIYDYNKNDDEITIAGRVVWFMAPFDCEI